MSATPAFRRRHYEAVAGVLARLPLWQDNAHLGGVVDYKEVLYDFARLFRADNHNFDGQQFYAAVDKIREEGTR